MTYNLGKVEEVNVHLKEGEDGWGKVELVSEDGDTVEALLPEDDARRAALGMVEGVIDRKDE